MKSPTCRPNTNLKYIKMDNHPSLSICCFHIYYKPECIVLFRFHQRCSMWTSKTLSTYTGMCMVFGVLVDNQKKYLAYFIEKFHAEIAKDGEGLLTVAKFKIFWGNISPDHPRKNLGVSIRSHLEELGVSSAWSLHKMHPGLSIISVLPTCTVWIFLLYNIIYIHVVLYTSANFHVHTWPCPGNCYGHIEFEWIHWDDSMLQFTVLLST